VRTQSLDFSFNELADMHRAGELIIDPEFQRMFRWSEGAQSRFIESLLLELPVPPIFLIERDDRIYELIDGLQRISSFLHFRGELEIDGVTPPPLVLSECDIVHELNGYTYANLPRSMEIKLKRSYIRAEILRKESDARLRYYMFKRLNTGGEVLSWQEVRNATIRLLSNGFNQFIIDLSRNTDFAFCTAIISEPARLRRFDQELVLRFFAFKNNFDSYRHDVADFLTDYMETVSDPGADAQFNYTEERAIFDKTFHVLRMIAESLGIGSRIFGTVAGPNGEPRGQFSVYHYEGLVLGLQAVIDRVDPSNAEQISALANIVNTGKGDPAFLTHTGAGKNQRGSLTERMNYFASRFEVALA
jgi:Protein of unknown function DUF262